MIWLLIPKIALLLIIVAFALEFAGRNETRRPFSRNSLNKRRWDDPNDTNKFDAAIPGSLVGSGLMLGHERFYLVSKDPVEQSKFLAGRI